MCACPSRNIRAALLPCSESTTCLFRTRPLDAADTLVFNEVFWVSMSYPALHQKTLRVDVCTTDKCHLEECLVRALSVQPSVLLDPPLHFREKAWGKHSLWYQPSSSWVLGRLIGSRGERAGSSFICCGVAGPHPFLVPEAEPPAFRIVWPKML